MTTTPELFDLTGRRAVVTGAAGLLGREFCRGLREAGAEVYALDCADGPLEEVASTTGSVPIRCDITKPDEVTGCIQDIAAGGDIDALVNSAAIDPKVTGNERARTEIPGSFSSYPLAAWLQSIEVNLTGTFVVSQAVARVMERQDRDRGRGAIVNIASTYALTGPDPSLYRSESGEQLMFKPVDYPTTKAGILGFSRALAAHYRGTGIRVNVLTPGGALASQDSGFVQRYSERTIVERMADPEEYRGAIVFLCSDASSYMTGANLVVDGGWTSL